MIRTVAVMQMRAVAMQTRRASSILQQLTEINPLPELALPPASQRGDVQSSSSRENNHFNKRQLGTTSSVKSKTLPTIHISQRIPSWSVPHSIMGNIQDVLMHVNFPKTELEKFSPRSFAMPEVGAFFFLQPKFLRFITFRHMNNWEELHHITFKFTGKQTPEWQFCRNQKFLEFFRLEWSVSHIRSFLCIC